MSASPRPEPGRTHDVLVVGGGPGGSTVTTLLARGGLSVVVAEREVFPRFHIGESLLPAMVPLLDRLGVREKVEAHGFLVKPGAVFYDQAADREWTFYFRTGPRWANYAYEVPRAEFDRVLLDHAAAAPRVTVLQPATVERVVFDGDGVTATVTDAHGSYEMRARFLVDASGRDGFLASRGGRRVPIPGLGKVSLFAHYRGARRWPGRDEGNIRLFVFDDGWFWWIPFAGDTTSVGCVLHARTVRDRRGSPEALFEAMIDRCPRVRDNLAGAKRITPVHTAANFSYKVTPVVGDRFLCVGDAMSFVDPVFSAGVFVAMQSAELAAAEILRAFGDGRFRADRFAGYEQSVEKGMRPFLRFIRKFYEPAFLDVFLAPRQTLGTLEAVTGVLAGGAFISMPLRMRAGLAAFFTLVRFNRWVRRRAGRPVESRLEW